MTHFLFLPLVLQQSSALFSRPCARINSPTGVDDYTILQQASRTRDTSPIYSHNSAIKPAHHHQISSKHYHQITTSSNPSSHHAKSHSRRHHLGVPRYNFCLAHILGIVTPLASSSTFWRFCFPPPSPSHKKNCKRVRRVKGIC